MRKTALVLGIMLYACCVAGQTRVIDSIVNEGELLFRLENACWRGTELLLKQHKNFRDSIGGSFAYDIDEAHVQCVFYSTEPDPMVVATVLFDTSFDATTAELRIDTRYFSTEERRLYTIRNRTMDEIDRDTSFILYENTSFCIVPVVDSIATRVYVMTVPEVKGILLFGNDYLLYFNPMDSIVAKKTLHKELIQVDFKQEQAPDLTNTFHLHTNETGKYITPTDICALRLFGKYTGWVEHSVMSSTHVSLWDLEINALTVLTKEQWARLNSDKTKKGLFGRKKK